MAMKWSGILGLAAFVAGAVTSRAYLRGEAERLRGGPDGEVVRLARALKPQATVVREDFQLVRIPEAFRDPRALRLEGAMRLIGRSVKRPLAAGTFLLEGDDAFGEGQAKLVDLVRPGFRVFVLRSDQLHSCEETRQGDRVDIVLVPRERGAAEVLLENVEVLAGKDPSTKTGVGSAASLALAVRPEEALKLVAAEVRGKMRILLRNPSDTFMAVEGGGQQIRTYEGGL
jgi:Flp pilus assembly protein CpaB